MHEVKLVRHRVALVAAALVVGLATVSMSLASTHAVGASSSAEDGELFGVATMPGGDAWAVGYAGTNPDTGSLALLWNGSRWKPVPSPSPQAPRSAAFLPLHSPMRGPWVIAATNLIPMH